MKLTYSIPTAWENEVVAMQVDEEFLTISSSTNNNSSSNSSISNNSSSSSSSSTPSLKTIYKMLSNYEYACNDLYQYGYIVAISVVLNTFVPMVIMIFVNGWAISTLMKSREALQVIYKINRHI